ncbi:hypothetical protein C8F01DRAFT_1097964 [Mycena amicta]|nr:hypothetical protein C8F01DRAFT_1097964 [Mycena amicta]
MSSEQTRTYRIQPPSHADASAASFNNPETGIALTWKLLKVIEDDPKILGKLFPGCGGNLSTELGGGATKAEALFLAAKGMWGAEHAAYFKELAAGPAKGREKVMNKVKNRLAWMTAQTHKITKEMKATGAGNEMTQEELDELTEDDPKRSAWGARLEKFPWYWTIHPLLAERPNLTPVALGNSEDGGEVSTVSRAQRPAAKSPSPDWSPIQPEDQLDSDDEKDTEHGKDDTEDNSSVRRPGSMLAPALLPHPSSSTRCRPRHLRTTSPSSLQIQSHFEDRQDSCPGCKEASLRS